tara:strand:- start:368 stop:559 length:192 start_codon:yes stop_codon:yes gene_type:complete
MFNLRYGKMINNSEKEINKFIPKVSNLNRNTRKEITLLTKFKDIDSNKIKNNLEYEDSEKNEI